MGHPKPLQGAPNPPEEPLQTPGRPSPHQDVEAGSLEQGDLVSHAEPREAREPLGKLHNLDDALGGQFAELVPEPQVQLHPVVSTRVLGAWGGPGSVREVVREPLGPQPQHPELAPEPQVQLHPVVIVQVLGGMGSVMGVQGGLGLPGTPISVTPSPRSSCTMWSVFILWGTQAQVMGVQDLLRPPRTYWDPLLSDPQPLNSTPAPGPAACLTQRLRLIRGCKDPTLGSRVGVPHYK